MNYDLYMLWLLWAYKVVGQQIQLFFFSIT